MGDRIDLYVRSGTGLSVLTDLDGRDYDAGHYRVALVQNYATRLRKALNPADWEQLFSVRGAGLFDRPVGEMQVQWRPVEDAAQ